MKFTPSSAKHKIKVLYTSINHGNKNYLINFDRSVQRKSYSSKSIVRQSRPIAELNQTDTLEIKNEEDTTSSFNKITGKLIPYILSASEFLSMKSLALFKSSSIEDLTKSRASQSLNLKDPKHKFPQINKTVSSENPENQTVLDNKKETANKSSIVTKSAEAKLKEWSLSNRAIMEEKLLKLCDSIPKATSALIKTILINDLYKILYDNSEMRYLIHRKRKHLFKELVHIREDAIAHKNMNLAGNINETLSLLGVANESQIKFGGINILSLDGGGN